MSICLRLTTQLKTIKDTFNLLSSQVDDFSNAKNLNSKEKVIKWANIFATRTTLLAELEKISFKPVINERFYIIPEQTKLVEKSIRIDFNEIIKRAMSFYKAHYIELPSDFELRAKDVWMRNLKEIKKEIATYGYDHVIIMPDNLPPFSELHYKINSEDNRTMVDGGYGIDSFLNDVRDSKSRDNSFRLVFVHKSKNLGDNYLLQSTKNKAPLNLTGKTIFTQWSLPLETMRTLKSEIQKEIRERADLQIKITLLNTIKFGNRPDSANCSIFAQGLTLAEYEILSTQFFEETGTGMDDDSHTLLLSSFCNNKFIRSGCDWNGEKPFPEIYTTDSTECSMTTGCRFCKIFT